MFRRQPRFRPKFWNRAYNVFTDLGVTKAVHGGTSLSSKSVQTHTNGMRPIIIIAGKPEAETKLPHVHALRVK